MPKLIYDREASSSPVFRVFLQDSSSLTGAGLTGLTSASTGLYISAIRELSSSVTAYTVAGSNVETITTLGTYAAPTSGKCRFKEIDATNMPGMYEIQLAQALLDTSDASRTLTLYVAGATNLATAVFEIELIGMDLQLTSQFAAAPAAELASIPTTTSSFGAMVQYLFQYFRNKRTVTATVETLFKEDAATTLGTSTISDDGTTFTHGEVG